MNERIRELIFEAITFRLDPDSECYEAQICPEDLEYFAELIVRECCLQVADVRIENDFEPVGDAVLARALAGIKQYFGVEE